MRNPYFIPLLIHHKHAKPVFKAADVEPAFIIKESPSPDLRINILTVFGAFQKPCLMVDTGDPALYRLIIANTQFVQKGRSADLYAVAETDCLHTCITQHSAGQHSHRIGIIEEPCIRAYILYIPGEIHHDRNRAEGSEYAAYAKCIRNSLPQTIFLRNLKVCDRAGIISADLDGIDHIIGTGQRLFAIIGPQMLLNPRPGSCIPVNSLQHSCRLIKTHRINIIKRNRALAKGRCHHAVTQHIFSKYR